MLAIIAGIAGVAGVFISGVICGGLIESFLDARRGKATFAAKRAREEEKRAREEAMILACLSPFERWLREQPTDVICYMAAGMSPEKFGWQGDASEDPPMVH